MCSCAALNFALCPLMLIHHPCRSRVHKLKSASKLFHNLLAVEKEPTIGDVV